METLWLSMPGGVLVYEFVPRDNKELVDDEPEGSWRLRGSPLTASDKGSSNSMCLAANGNIVALATDTHVGVYQYDPAHGDWQTVGTIRTDTAEVPTLVTCTPDGRNLVVWERRWFNGFGGVVSIWRAQETESK